MHTVPGHLTPHCFFFFFNDTATTEIYTLSLHDALPISTPRSTAASAASMSRSSSVRGTSRRARSEEHTSELQSQSNLVCRLLLEKKKMKPLHAMRRCAHIVVQQLNGNDSRRLIPQLCAR